MADNKQAKVKGCLHAVPYQLTLQLSQHTLYVQQDNNIYYLAQQYLIFTQVQTLFQLIFLKCTRRIVREDKLSVLVAYMSPNQCWILPSTFLATVIQQMIAVSIIVLESFGVKFGTFGDIQIKPQTLQCDYECQT